MIPDEFGLRDHLVVVIDVLRSSTTICTALANGAEEIIPVAELEEAVRLARQIGRSDVLLAGERNGLKPDGFDLGNSPLEYQASVVGGKKLVLTTSNGTPLLEKVKGAPTVCIAAFVNLSSVVRFVDTAIQRSAVQTINIACAGTAGRFALEDVLAAGALIHQLLSSNHCELDDASEAAKTLYQCYQGQLDEKIRLSEHALYLSRCGLDSDIRFATAIDRFDIVPVFDNGTITAIGRYGHNGDTQE